MKGGAGRERGENILKGERKGDGEKVKERRKDERKEENIYIREKEREMEGK